MKKVSRFSGRLGYHPLKSYIQYRYAFHERFRLWNVGESVYGFEVPRDVRIRQIPAVGQEHLIVKLITNS